MEVTLTLEKKALPEPAPEPVYTITLDEKAFDFGKKCIDIAPSKSSIKIENKSDESISFEIVSTSEASNYDISKKEGTIATNSTETIEVGPKEGLKLGDYKENFNIKVNGEEAKAFSASFQVVEHDKNTTWSSDDEKHWYECKICGTKLDIDKHDKKEEWSSDSEKHWHECKICGAKLDIDEHNFVWKVDQQATATRNGYGHNECSVCGYKKASVIIAATGTTRTVSTVRTTTATTRASLLSKIIPTTGDDSHIVLWLGVLVICGVTILGALGRYFSKRK